ncbi:MAG: biopolymer transporter ExbD [Verrucomicrobia bacterium]|nr:biopolymer transporter ExbD [Verrucomicrobiota bacterium]
MRFAGESGPIKPPFPLAAMIDILFLLMLFFMITSLYAKMESELNISLPVSKEGSPIQREPTEIIINVKPDGIYVMKQIEYDLAAFDRKLAELKALPGGLDERIIVRGDKEAKYDYIIRLLDLFKKYNIWDVSFAVAKAEETAAATVGAP